MPDRFYSTDILEQFYEPAHNRVNLVPVYTRFVDTSDQGVWLSGEHDAFGWICAEEVERYLLFENRRSADRHVGRRFVREKPDGFLRVDVGRAG